MFSRLEMMYNKEIVNEIYNSKIIIFGIGGVGSFAAEAIARCGVKNITIVDFDEISLSNINRQIHALNSTVGKSKVDVMKERILDINPNCNVIAIKELVYKNLEKFFNIDYDYVIDAIDTLESKIELIKYCKNNDINIISSLGFGNKVDPSKIKIGDVFNTYNCPLSKKIRNRLRKEKISSLKVVYSEELAKKTLFENNNESDFTEFRNNFNSPRKSTPASIAFIPSIAGLNLAAFVINKIVEKYLKHR